MSSVYFIGDLHFQHRGILKFGPPLAREGLCINEHDSILIDNWNKTVRKKDLVYVVGDVAFSQTGLEFFDELNGRKILVRGNHDKLKLEEYLKYFEEIHGMVKYKGFWVTHCPMHPQELFGKRNIHGHVHSNTVLLNGEMDPRYINVSVEACRGVPVLFKDIADGIYDKQRKF